MATLAQRVSLCLRQAGYRAFPGYGKPRPEPLGRRYWIKRQGTRSVCIVYRGQSGGNSQSHTYTDPRWREVMLFAIILKRSGFEVALDNYGMELWVAATLTDLHPLLARHESGRTYLGEEFLTPLD